MLLQSTFCISVQEEHHGGGVCVLGGSSQQRDPEGSAVRKPTGSGCSLTVLGPSSAWWVCFLWGAGQSLPRYPTLQIFLVL